MGTVDLGHDRGWLEAAVARAVFACDAALGRPLQITSAGRTRAEQQALWDAYVAGTGPLAAAPGTSLHESGLAIDTDDATWLRARPAFGFVNTGIRFGEPWHFEYEAAAAATTTTTQEDDMSAADAVKAEISLERVRGWYTTYTGRDADLDGLEYWATLAASSGAEPARLEFTKGTEVLGHVLPAFYRDELGRDPDADGLAYWTKLGTTVGADAVLAEMRKGDEWKARHP